MPKGAMHPYNVLTYLRTWGTHGDEPAAFMPGDALLPDARLVQTHAVTIAAARAMVWPWLVQMGAGRGGFYSYSWLENLAGCRLTNADRIVPQFQDLAVGDTIPLHPKMPGWPVAALDAPHTLVLAGAFQRNERVALQLDGGPWRGSLAVVWSFVLLEPSPETTRLLVRFRVAWPPAWWRSVVYYAMLEPGHFVMERKMLLGIKRRAEALQQRRV